MSGQLLDGLQFVDTYYDPGLYYVYDAEDHRAWGPFESEHMAIKFVEEDKYMDSWGHLYYGSVLLTNFRNLVVYKPSKYKGETEFDMQEESLELEVTD